MASVFFSYSHADEALRDQLEKQLSLLKRQGVITTWHDRRIGAGQDFGQSINDHVETDDIILLLVSADFLDSNYCYDIEMTRALARHEAGEAIVIPVILRACEWHGAPFGKLLGTPSDGKPVTQWPDRDQAFLEVARAVRGAAERVESGKAKLVEKSAAPRPRQETSPIILGTSPRSSNLRIAKEFTEHDKDAFRVETFDYIARFFEHTLAELATRNSGIDGTFRRIDANRFTAVAYRDGRSLARCTVFMSGRHFGGDIGYSNSDSGADNSYNESVSIGSDDQMLFWKPMGMSALRQDSRDAKLSQEGAAELFWGIFVQPLQGRER
ncbi:toll/interleukin-1 receptor domain-containing protein [Roseococcus sp.]|uniref:toll/interleukin-1 receptor domain-containing protein n=1 Tax=Roseococcus sp. TaxID=2109646 RepID=UPI003BA875FB